MCFSYNAYLAVFGNIDFTTFLSLRYSSAPVFWGLPCNHGHTISYMSQCENDNNSSPSFLLLRVGAPAPSVGNLESLQRVELTLVGVVAWR